MLTVDTNVETQDWLEASVDWPALAERAAQAAMAQTPYGALLTIDINIEIACRFVGDAAIRDLNQAYRGRDSATNVLSFPLMGPDDIEMLPASGGGEVLLGDIVLAYETVMREAQEQGKTTVDHVTHLLVHGTLHLLDYDHLTDEQANEMEALERQILAGMGIADPYARGAIGHD